MHEWINECVKTDINEVFIDIAVRVLHMNAHPIATVELPVVPIALNFLTFTRQT